MREILLFPLYHPFVTLCVYGVAAGVLFARFGRFADHPLFQWAYVMGYLMLTLLFANSRGKSLDMGGGYGAAFAGPIIVVAGIFIGFLFNLLALQHCAENVIGAIGRFALSLNQVIWRKSYDKAEGAEVRGDFETAIALYGDEIEKDPEDGEARRRLAEVLLKNEQPREAAAQLEELLNRSSGGQWCKTAFRLAEVQQDDLARPESAAELYRRIAEEYPDDEMAAYAQSRLRIIQGERQGVEDD